MRLETAAFALSIIGKKELARIFQNCKSKMTQGMRFTPKKDDDAEISDDSLTLKDEK